MLESSTENKEKSRSSTESQKVQDKLDLLSDMEQKLNCSLPSDLKMVLRFLGYGNKIPWIHFNEQTLHNIETEVKGSASYIENSLKLDTAYIRDFKIFSGYKKILLLFAAEIKKSEANLKQSYKRKLDIEDNVNFEEESTSILHTVKQWIKSNLEDENVPTPEILAKLEVRSEASPNKNFVCFAHIKCCFCTSEIKSGKLVRSNGSSKWVLSNFYKHLKSHFDTAKKRKTM